MTILSFLRMPTSAITLLPLLIPILIHPTTESLASPAAPSRRRSLFRFGPPPRAHGGDGDLDGNDGNDNNNNNNNNDDDDGGNPIERIVRTVTRNDEYKFGDITKSVVGATTQGVEGTVRSVTRNKDYHFGDLTKKVVGVVPSAVEDIVKSATGNEEYHFGDLTKGTLSAAASVASFSEKSLKTLRDNSIHEFVDLLNMFWTERMGERERSEAFTVVVFSGAILVLAYNFVANIMSGIAFAAAWTRIGMEAGTSPLASGMLWSKFLVAKSTIDIFFGGPCLPARAMITIPWFFQYRKFVVGMNRNSPLREKFPIINRYVSLILSWLIANLAFVGGTTLLMMKMGSLTTGVPIFSVA